MGATGLESAFETNADILSTTVSEATKKILVQTGANTGEGQVDNDGVEWVQHVGFASLPANPEPGKESAQAVVIRQGTNDVAIGSRDQRGLALYGALKPGETCLYAVGADGTAQARILLKADGSINLFTKKDNETGGAGMGIFVNADGSISIASHNGAALLVGTDGSVKLFNGSGGIQVLADGSIKLASGAKVEISGASITMGGPAAMPIAMAVPVTTILTALQVEIAAVAAALVACMNIPGPILPPHGTAAAAATAAVGVGAAVLAANTALVPTKRTSAD